MNFQIVKYGSPVLRKKSDEVTENDNHALIAEKLFTIVKKQKGIGLAGPQIGILKRIFVIDTSLLSENDASVNKVEEAIVNPEIIWFSSKKGYYNEGCLSIPGVYDDVLRSVIIRVKYYDLNFNLIENELNGIKARIFQHEYDHLNGILFTDRISPLKKILLRKKLSEIIKHTKK